MPADLATLQLRLAAAETAYDELMVSGATVKLAHMGKLMEFKPTEAGVLKGYINDLNGQIAALTGVGLGRPRSRRFAF